MKKIESVIPSARLESALAALKELDLGGFTYYDSKGRGQIPRPEIHSGRGTGTYRPEFNTNATIVVVTKDSLADKVVEKILESTSTGLTGEGKIFVSDVDEVIDIGSKQCWRRRIIKIKSNFYFAICSSIAWATVSMPLFLAYSSTNFSCSAVRHTGIVLFSSPMAKISPSKIITLSHEAVLIIF